jgi:hypothetical protein
MGNDVSTAKSADRNTPTEERPMSNLSVLMNQHQEASAGIPIEIPVSAERSLHDEADSASGPPVRHLVSSAPNLFPPSGVHNRLGSAVSSARVASPSLSRRFSSGVVVGVGTPPTGFPVEVNVDEVRR